MKEERLLNVFGEVDDKFIESSAPKNVSENYSFEQNYSATEKPSVLSVKQQKNSVFLRAISAVVACAVTVGVVFAVKFIANKNGNVDFINPGESDDSSFYYNGGERPWEEWPTPVQFSNFEYNGGHYSYFTLRDASDVVDKNEVGELIDSITISVVDLEDDIHETNISLYEIKNISGRYAAAVKFENEECYYNYRNYGYKPETLGEYIEDLNFKENMKFFHWVDSADNIVYKLTDDKIIWDYLLSDTNAKRVDIDENGFIEGTGGQVNEFKYDMRIFSDLDGNLPIIGGINGLVRVVKEGYICISYGTHSAYAETFNRVYFNIGEDKAKSFIKYVKENLENNISKPENSSTSDEKENKPEESKPEESKPEESKPEDANSVIIKGIEYNIETTTKLKLFEVTDEDLKQIGKLTNLTNLELGGDFSDLTPLAGLTKLTSLYLSGSKISDLTPLSSLTNLTILNLKNNTRLVDITPLAQLANLKELYLSGSKIGNLTPLASFTNMEELWLVGNQITDITPLSGLTNLLYLHLDNNDISDITPIAKLTNLIKLSLRDNDISDLTQLTGLAALSSLDLSRNKISDIAPLAKLTNLAYLDLEYNQVSDADIARLKERFPDCCFTCS